MLPWHDCQKLFADAISGRNIDTFLDFVCEGGASQEKRLSVYRNNFFYKVTEALAAIYPAIKRLVGDGFFHYAAHEYIQIHRPKNGILARYGSDFAEFLDGFAPAANYPYLGDVARLEFAWLQAYHEKDVVPLTARQLQSLPYEGFSDLRLKLHPSRRFLTSPYPIAKIWQLSCQDEDPQEQIEFSRGTTHVLVIRPRMEVEVRTLTPEAYYFLERLDKGDALTLAFEAALEKNGDFNLQDNLQQLIVGETFVEYQL